ncbi:MAG: hypothetical protein JST58_04640 [Bacteroidetes bacterium]|jgi:hypothetical protein|nr:hypothetical protein [Bacteroidota bacterium]
MCKNNIIRAFLSALLMIVFAFSITPQIYLHDLLADHRDSPIKSNFSDQAQLSKTGFHCTWDNLVVESPFINKVISPFISIQKQFVKLESVFKTDCLGLDYFYFELRGPPGNFVC